MHVACNCDSYITLSLALTFRSIAGRSGHMLPSLLDAYMRRICMYLGSAVRCFSSNEFADFQSRPKSWISHAFANVVYLCLWYVMGIVFLFI